MRNQGEWYIGSLWHLCYAYLLLAVGAEGQQGHGAVGGTAAWAGGHSVLRGLAGALQASCLAARLTPKGCGQVLPHLLPLGLLDVVLGGVLQVSLHLEEVGRDGVKEGET